MQFHPRDVLSVLRVRILTIGHVEILNHYRLIVLIVLCSLGHVDDARFGEGRTRSGILVMCLHRCHAITRLCHIISWVFELLQNAVQLVLSRGSQGLLEGWSSGSFSRLRHIGFFFRNNRRYFQGFAMERWKVLADVTSPELVGAEIWGGTVWTSSRREIYLSSIDLVLSFDPSNSICTRIHIRAWRCD